jgi:hypothetical protein
MGKEESQEEQAEQILACSKGLRQGVMAMRPVGAESRNWKTPYGRSEQAISSAAARSAAPIPRQYRQHHAIRRAEPDRHI